MEANTVSIAIITSLATIISGAVSSYCTYKIADANYKRDATRKRKAMLIILLDHLSFNLKILTQNSTNTGIIHPKDLDCNKIIVAEYAPQEFYAYTSWYGKLEEFFKYNTGSIEQNLEKQLLISNGEQLLSHLKKSL